MDNFLSPHNDDDDDDDDYRMMIFNHNNNNNNGNNQNDDCDLSRSMNRTEADLSYITSRLIGKSYRLYYKIFDFYIAHFNCIKKKTFLKPLFYL